MLWLRTDSAKYAVKRFYIVVQDQNKQFHNSSTEYNAVLPFSANKNQQKVAFLNVYLTFIL